MIYSRFSSHFRLGQLRQAVRNIPAAVKSRPSSPMAYSDTWCGFSPTRARIGSMKSFLHFLYPTACGSAANPAFRIRSNSPSSLLCVAPPRLAYWQKRTRVTRNHKSTIYSMAVNYYRSFLNSASRVETFAALAVNHGGTLS